METETNSIDLALDGASTSQFINVQIIIDTDKIIKDYPNPSKNSKSPTQIGLLYEYMVVSTDNLIKGQGTSSLEFSAENGDIVRFNAISEYYNMDNPVLIYGLGPIGGSPNVFGTFISTTIEKTGIIPGSGIETIPPNFTKMKFWYYQSTVEKSGTENFNIKYAIYQRVRGKENPELFGYFQYDPKIIVKF
jgi:hypothetical protein